MSGLSIASLPPAEAGAGFIARRDPRLRLVAALAFVVAVAALHRAPALMVALILALALAAAARLSLAALRHRLLHVEGFLVVLLVLLPFTMPGEPVAELGPLTVSGPGLERAVAIVLKVNAAMIAVFALLGGLDPVRLGAAAADLGAPLRLVHLFQFVVRYVGVFQAETARLIEAMRARAFVPRSNWHTWRTLGHLAGLMLIRSLERAARVEEAMRCRGFAGKLPTPGRVPLPRGELCLTAAFLVMLAALVLADRLA